MALTRAIAADGEQISKTEKTVTSALNQNVSVFLPVIDDGTSGQTTGSVIGFEANGRGAINVKDIYGHLIVVVRPGERAEVFAKATGTNVGVWALAAANVAAPMIRTEGKLANGTVAAVLTANSGPTGYGTAVAGWLKSFLPDGTEIAVPYWAKT